MKLKNRLKTLHRADDATADSIMRQHPPQYDTDRVFRNAYDSYRNQKEENEKEICFLTEECTEVSTCPHVRRPLQSFLKFGLYAACTVGFFGLLMFISQLDDARLPVKEFPDDSQYSSAPHSAENLHTETSANAGAVHTETMTTTASHTEITETIPQETTPESSEAQTNFIEIIYSLPAEEGTAKQTETGTVPTVQESTGTEITETETAETTTTTQPTETAKPYFIADRHSDGSLRMYLSGYSTEPVEEHEHSFEAEGFTVTDKQVRGEVPSVIYKIEDENGRQYQMEQIKDLRVQFSCDRAEDSRSIPYEINGMPAMFFHREGDSKCLLMWYDGCHVCFMTSELENLASMELLVRSQVTY